MNKNETPEMLLNRICHSAKTRRLAVFLMLAGMFVCIIPLLPPVQNAIYAFVDDHASGTRASGTFDNAMRSLLSLPLFGLLVFTFALCCLFSKAIATFLADAKNAKLISLFAVGIAVVLLGFIGIFSYRYGWQRLNSDHASEMVLGKLLAGENALVSRSWHYSTEIRLIYQTLFTMPLFKLFGGSDNWALIRAISIVLNNAVLLLSYVFLARQMKLAAKWIFITAIFLIMPVSNVFWDIVTFGGYYIFFIAQLFCCLGLFIALTGKAEALAAKRTAVYFLLFTLLSFALGAQGIRALLCVHIPLLLASIYISSQTAQKEKPCLFLGCFGFVICCAGFAFNYLLHFWYSFYSFRGMRLENLYDKFTLKLGQNLVYLTEFFGFSAENRLMSAWGLFGIAAIIGTVVLFWAAGKSFRPADVQETEISGGIRFMPIFFIVSVIFNIFVFIIVDESVTDRYFIPFMILYVPLAAVLFERLEKTWMPLKRIALISGITLFIAGQGCLNFQNLAASNMNAHRNGYLKYLWENRLGYGFATFWNANITTELSGGRIELAGLESDGLEEGKNQFRIQGWLNPVKFYDPSYSQGESFLLLTRAEWELAKATGRDFARQQPDYEDDSFIIIRYPDAGIIYREVLDE